MFDLQSWRESLVLKIFIFALGISVTGSGCSKSSGVDRQKISGIVMLDGTPLKNGVIAFEGSGAGASGGATISGGKYEMPANRGIPPGEYTVRITSGGDSVVTEEAPGEPVPSASTSFIPAIYNSKSTLKKTVEAGKPSKFDFELSSKAK